MAKDKTDNAGPMLVFNRENIHATVDYAGILTICIDTTTDLGPSASGKSMMVASTRGNKPLAIGEHGLTLSINAYRRVDKAEAVTA